MDRLGEVTAVDGKWLEITFCRPSDCEKCHACLGGEKTMTVRLEGQGAVGDKALVSMPVSTITRGALLAYMLPLAGMLIGMLVGDALLPLEHSLGAVIGAGVGLGLPLLYLLATEKKRRADPRWTPQLKQVLHTGGGDAQSPQQP